MSRPRRAAAARAVENMAIDTDKENNAPDRPKTAADTPSPTRRLRRASYRSGKHGPRSLARRRADFDRIASHHIAAQRNLPPSSRPTSSATDLPSDASDPLLDDVVLSPSWAQNLVRDSVDEDHALALMRAMLQKLRRIDNLAEARESAEESLEGVGKRLPGERDDLHGLAEVLAAERFISHDSSHVQLLAACALAEILRISAPDPPISSHKLKEVCSLFIEQLAVLVAPKDQMEAYRFSLLEQLATVKTFVIFCDDDDVVCDLFACFYATSRAHQPVKVRQYLGDILASLLDEAEELSYSILDALVAPLIPALGYSAPAVALSERVVHTSANFIQVPLCSMLNASIRQIRQLKSTYTPEKQGRRRTPIKKKRGSDEDADSGDLSAHHNHISDLVVAVNRIASELLIYVIPSLEDRIRSPDESVRLANVHLLARLFTSRLDMIESYPSLFAEFLTRHRDVSASIRAEVCTALGDLMLSHPKHRESLDQMLRDRALDREEAVRVAAVRAIGASVDVSSDDLLKMLATRLRDRKPSVRNEALAQLTLIYNGDENKSRKLITPASDADILGSLHSDDSSSQDLDAVPNKDVAISSDSAAATRERHAAEARMRRLSWLPNTLIQAHIALKSAGDYTVAAEIERVIFEKIPGLRSDEADVARSRLRRFATFLAGLNDNAFAHLILLAQERRRCCEALLRIVEYRLKSRRSTSTSAGKGNEEDDNAPSKTFSKRTRQPGETNKSKPPVADSGEIQSLAKALSRFLPGKTGNHDDCHELCMSLATAVDLKIYEKIAKAIDGNSTHSERSAACHDAISRLGSKSPPGLFLQTQVFPKCLPGVFTSLHFSVACAMALDDSKQSNISEVAEKIRSSVEPDARFPVALCGVLRYLEITSKHATPLLGHNVDGVRSLVTLELKDSDSSSDVILTGLKLMTRLPEEAARRVDVQDLHEILEKRISSERLFDIEQGTLLAKWATRVLIWLHSSAAQTENPLSGIVKGIAGKFNSFDGDAESIVASITALSQLAKHSPAVFKPVALESFDFARGLLCGSLNAKLVAFGDGESHEEETPSYRRKSLSRRSSVPSHLGEEAYCLPDMITSKRASCLAELVHRAVKLLVYALVFVDSHSEELHSLFETFLGIILAKNGDVFGVAEDAAEDSEEDEVENKGDHGSIATLCAMSRLCAGRGMLYLARHPKFFRQLSPPIFVSTVLVAQDEHAAVRITFAKTIVNMILKKRLPFRWVVALPLMAVDPIRENVTQIRSLMTSLFRHRRRVFEKARLEGSSSSLQLLPESTLPELIWVLANLPEVEADREAGFRESEKCLELMLERLLESNDYAGVLNEYIESLSIAQDATEPEDEGPGPKTESIAELGRIAGAILKKKQAGKKWNLAEHPGRISLPKDMFRIINRQAETSGVPPPSLLEVARKYDKDKSRESGKKKKPGDLVSRVKAEALTKSAASSVPEDEPKMFTSAEDSGGRVGKTEQSFEPVEMEVIQDATRYTSPTIQGEKRGKKRLSGELANSSPIDTEVKAARTREILPETKRDTSPTSQQDKLGRKRDSEDLEGLSSPDSTLKAVMPLETFSGLNAGDGDKESGDKESGDKEQGTAGLKSPLITGTPSARRRDAEKRDGEEGHAQRTRPRSKQVKVDNVEKTCPKPKKSKEVEATKNTKVEISVVRRSARNRRI